MHCTTWIPVLHYIQIKEATVGNESGVHSNESKVLEIFYYIIIGKLAEVKLCVSQGQLGTYSVMSLQTRHVTNKGTLPV